MTVTSRTPPARYAYQSRPTTSETARTPGVERRTSVHPLLTQLMQAKLEQHSLVLEYQQKGYNSISDFYHDYQEKSQKEEAKRQRERQVKAGSSSQAGSHSARESNKGTGSSVASSASGRSRVMSPDRVRARAWAKQKMRSQRDKSISPRSRARGDTGPPTATAMRANIRDQAREIKRQESFRSTASETAPGPGSPRLTRGKSIGKDGELVTVLSEDTKEELFSRLYSEKLQRKSVSATKQPILPSALKETEEATFKPQINEKSKAMFEQRWGQAQSNRVEWLYKMGVEKKRRQERRPPERGSAFSSGERLDPVDYKNGDKPVPWLEDDQYRKVLQAEVDERDEECSFQPAINPKSREYVHHAGHAKTPFNMRVREWKRQRDLKVARERQEKDQLEVQECTFHPTISNTISATVLQQAEAMRMLRLHYHEDGPQPVQHLSWQDSLGGISGGGRMVQTKSGMGYSSALRPKSAPHVRRALASVSKDTDHLGRKVKRKAVDDLGLISSLETDFNAVADSGFKIGRGPHNTKMLVRAEAVPGTPEGAASVHTYMACQRALDAISPHTLWEGKHYERLHKGRERQMEIRRILNLYDGSTWRDRSTTPQEFQLGRATDTPPRSLRPPVSWDESPFFQAPSPSS